MTGVSAPSPLLPLDAARAKLAEQVRPLPGRRVALADASGLRLAADATSDIDLPPFDTSSMDGYAVRCADLARGAPLAVAFEAAAGHPEGILSEGSAVRIYTGAPLPQGADAVVPQESATVYQDGTVGLRPVAPGHSVRYRGEVLAAGAVVATVGDEVSPQRLAVLAAAGCADLDVIPRPRVALLVTGDELVPASETPSAGAIRDVNGPMLAALAATARVFVAWSGSAGDEAPPLAAAFTAALAAAEVVVATGGVSVGDRDLVPSVVADLGGEFVFHRVAIQPGKPILVARVGRGWLIGLPGNPVSVLVGWRMFVRPLIEALAGDGRAFAEQPLSASLAVRAGNPGDRLQLRPAHLEMAWGRLSVRVLPWRGSHDVAFASQANALARLEAGAELDVGDEVAVFPLPWTIAP